MTSIGFTKQMMHVCCFTKQMVHVCCGFVGVTSVGLGGMFGDGPW